MTNKELSELIQKKNDLTAKIKEANRDNDELKSQLTKINDAIKHEEFVRETSLHFDEHYNIFKNMLNNYKAPRETKDHLWIVKINGQRYSAHSGKHTWTSEKRAKNAIFDHLYDILYDIKDTYYGDAYIKVDLKGILNKLIENKIITIKQIL